MKLTVFGATGGIGQEVITQALAAGHEVTAAVRRPDAITIKHERLTVNRVDALDPATIGQSIVGRDAIVSAIGARDKAPTTIYSAGIANIIQGMQAARVRRLLCVSASGLEPGPVWQRVIAKLFLWTMFKESFTDLVRMEAVVRKSNLDWTIVRPPRLTDGPRTGQYQVAVNKHLSNGWKLSRADVADYILMHLNSPVSYCGVVEIAY